jgi:hypothetical protein
MKLSSATRLSGPGPSPKGLRYYRSEGSSSHLRAGGEEEKGALRVWQQDGSGMGKSEGEGRRRPRRPFTWKRESREWKAISSGISGHRAFVRCIEAFFPIIMRTHPAHHHMRRFLSRHRIRFRAFSLLARGIAEINDVPRETARAKGRGQVLAACWTVSLRFTQTRAGCQELPDDHFIMLDRVRLCR